MVDYQDQIIEAISLRKKLKLNYKNEGYRVVCPHILYFSDVGNKLLDAYQVSGYAKNLKDVPGWKPFYISEITDLVVLDDTFEIASGYNPSNRNKYLTIVAKV